MDASTACHGHSDLDRYRFQLKPRNLSRYRRSGLDRRLCSQGLRRWRRSRNKFPGSHIRGPGQWRGEGGACRPSLTNLSDGRKRRDTTASQRIWNPSVPIGSMVWRALSPGSATVRPPWMSGTDCWTHRPDNAMVHRALARIHAGTGQSHAGNRAFPRSPVPRFRRCRYHRGTGRRADRIGRSPGGGRNPATAASPFTRTSSRSIGLGSRVA